MSELTDYQQSADSAPRKRCPSPDQDEGSTIPCKSSKVSDSSHEAGVISENCRKSKAKSNFEERAANEGHSQGNGQEAAVLLTDQDLNSTDGTGAQPVNKSSGDGNNTSKTEKPQSSEAQGAKDSKEGPEEVVESKQHSSTPRDQSDSAAIAAAEALASLTGGDGEDSLETPCSSDKVKHVKQGSKFKQRGGHQSSRASSKTQAAAADSSTSVHSADREDAEDLPEADEGDESISGSSSTPSSSFPSDNEDNDDGECAIVSVKMAPEMRQSVALLAQVQMRLEALEKKSARLHQRLELKMSRQRRPHLDQRSSITKTIPGFWVTAVSFKRKQLSNFLNLSCV